MATLTYLMKTHCRHRLTGQIDEFYSGLAQNYTLESLCRRKDDPEMIADNIRAAHDPTHEHWQFNAVDILDANHDDFWEDEWEITITKGPFQVEVPDDDVPPGFGGRDVTVAQLQ